MNADPKIYCNRCGAEVSTIATRQYGWRIRSHLCAGRRAEQRGLHANEQAQVDAAIAAEAEAARKDADSSASLSADGLYRYELRRRFREPATSGEPTKEKAIAWVMLNPSTADAMLDDPTIRKCLEFSRRLTWDASRMIVVNLYAFRSTSPDALRAMVKRNVDIVGPENDDAIRAAIIEAELVVCAWGAHPTGSLKRYGGPERVERVLDILTDVRGVALRGVACLDRIASGGPAHPLMLPYDRVRDGAPLPWPLSDGVGP